MTRRQRPPFVLEPLPPMFVICAVCGWPQGYEPATHRYLHGHEYLAVPS